MIKVGTAGSPSMCKTTLEGIEAIHKLGLDGFEVEFTHGVAMKNELAKKIGEANNINLSVHGPYYINLNSHEAKKQADSEKRILDSCERAHYMRADPVVFHAGFYVHRTPSETYSIIRQELDDLIQTISANNWDVTIAPETTGKKSQFGSLEELVSLCQDVEGLRFTLDWSHMWAREQGKADFDKIAAYVEKELGKRFMKSMHMHMSGIEFTAKGEKRHLNFADSKFPWKSVVETMKRFNIAGSLTCESPNQETDALKIKKALQ